MNKNHGTNTRRTKPRISDTKALALLASAMAAVAPSATNAPTAPAGGVAIAQAQAQQAQGMQASQSQAVAGAQQGMMPVGYGSDYRRGYSDWSTFPAWNQRKARKAARRINSKSVKKRWK